jgi:hypothetical protein
LVATIMLLVGQTVGIGFSLGLMPWVLNKLGKY